MATLEDFLAQFALTQADQAAARKQALMMAGMGLLGARKGREGEAMARAGLLGMDTYNQGLAGAQQGKLDKYKLAQEWQKQQDAQKAAAEAAADAARVSEAKNNSVAALAAPFAATGPVPKPNDVERLRRMMMATQNPANAKIYGELADKMQEKFGAATTQMQGGRPVLARFGDQGSSQVVPGMEPPPDIQVIDTGGSKRVIDKLRQAPVDIPVTMDPYQQAQVKLGQGNLAVAQGNLAQRRTEFDAQRTEGGGKSDKPPTEAQANAAMFGIRAKDTDRTLIDMEKAGFNPTGLGMARDMATAGNLTTNWMASAKGQQYINTGRNFVAAVLRKESGAQITEHEWKQGQELYVPMPGDGPDVLEQKRRNRQLAIQGMDVAAGPHVAAPAPRGATGGWSIEPAN